jgi:lysophospholipase L1-like esterase
MPKGFLHRKVVRFYIVFIIFSNTQESFTQPVAILDWWDPATSTNSIEGRGWPADVNQYYTRLPAKAEKSVNTEVWRLSKNAAGLLIRFKTNAEQITIRYQVEGAFAMPHMPATGVSGIDLYGVDTSNNYLWCAGKYSFKDTIEYKFTNLKPTKTSKGAGIEYRLYLPLYNTIKWLQIGTPNGSVFNPLPARTLKPIVVYGTSIVQGACASRPGMAWPAIVSRKLNNPVINLGFSGTGRLDKEVIDLLNEIDARVYVLDCLPNLVGGKAAFTNIEIRDKIINAVREIRRAHAQTPIVLTDHFGYTDALINPSKLAEYLQVNAVNKDAFKTLQREGFKSLFLLPSGSLRQDMDTMVDGIHPSDLGMMRFAEAYFYLFKKMKGFE